MLDMNQQILFLLLKDIAIATYRLFLGPMHFVPFVEFTILHVHVGNQKITSVSVHICPSLV